MTQVPYGFRWTNPPINITRSGGLFTSDFNITIYKPIATTTYYVDPINGNNASAGTIGAPLLDIAVALAKTDVDHVRPILTADYIARGAKGWNNTQPTRSVALINETGFRLVCPANASANGPTFTAHLTLPNVYQFLSSAATTQSMHDLKPINRVILHPNVPSAFAKMVKVNSEAEVGSTPGSWFNDTVNTFCQAPDSRNLVGDTFMQNCTIANSGRFPSVNNATMYLKNIDFVGGRPWYSLCASTVTGTILAAEGCSFQQGNVNGVSNGLNIAAFQQVYLYRCSAYNNGADDWNFHSFESNGTTPATSPQVIMVECASAGGGTTGSTQSSDNTFTGHDFADIISLNCKHGQSDDRVVAMTNSCHSWMLGNTVEQAEEVAAAKESVCALESAKIWIDTVSVTAGSNPQWIAAQTSTISHYNSGTVVNAGTGEATGTIAEYNGALGEPSGNTGGAPAHFFRYPQDANPVKNKSTMPTKKKEEKPSPVLDMASILKNL